MTYYRKSTATSQGINPYTEYAAVLLRQRHGDPRITSSSELLFECDYSVFGRIADKVHKTFPVCEIDSISQVNAPQMYGMYLLRKEELQVQCSGRPYGTEVQELELFHVTTKSKGIESLKNGLDWRRTRRSKFGRGVSFSDDADYADFYANNTSSEDDKRVIIVCAVLVSKTWRVNNNRNNRNKQPGSEVIVPPGTCDTTVSPNGRVFVKYYDYEFYPLYMVFYRRRPEYVEVSRYNNNVKKIGATPQRRYTLEEMEKRKREQEERERREKEEQLKRHQEMQRKQQEFRLRQQREEEQGRWQSQQWERQRREELAQLNRDQQHWRQQKPRDSRQDSSCHIL